MKKILLVTAVLLAAVQTQGSKTQALGVVKGSFDFLMSENSVGVLRLKK